MGLAKRWRGPLGGSAWSRPRLEPLEDRILLDAGLPPAIVVGRTLSAYMTGGVQNNRGSITFTVYNQQATPVSGVLLTDTLRPGVTFQSASALPDRSGRDLAWSLGTINGYDRASVTLNVPLSDQMPLQLDLPVRLPQPLRARRLEPPEGVDQRLLAVPAPLPVVVAGVSRGQMALSLRNRKPKGVPVNVGAATN